MCLICATLWQKIYIIVQSTFKKTQKTVKTNIETSMKNPKNYVKFFKSEFKTDVYLDYDDISHFRKFCFHYVILNWYFVYNQKCDQKNLKSTFGFFKNLKKLEIKLFSITEKLMTKYSLKNLNIEKIKKINNTIKNYIYVDILIELIKNIEIVIAELFFFSIEKAATSFKSVWNRNAKDDTRIHIIKNGFEIHQIFNNGSSTRVWKVEIGIIQQN